MASKNPGPLSSEELSVGIVACIENSQSLIRAGNLLLLEGCLGSALANFSIADQENGKVQVLWKMAELASDDDANWDRLWKAFRDHRNKAASGYMGSRDQGLSDLEWGNEARFAKKVYGPKAERIRQGVLYVDFIKADRTWTSPWNADIAVLTRIRETAQKTLEGLLEIRNRDLFSPKALSIKKDVYTQFSGPTIPKGANAPKKYEIIGNETRFRLTTYFDKLEAEGFDVPPEFRY